MRFKQWARGAIIAAVLVATTTIMAQPAKAVVGIYFGGYGGGIGYGAGWGYRGIGYGRSIGYSNYGYGSSYYGGYRSLRLGYGSSYYRGYGYVPSSSYGYSPTYSSGYSTSAVAPTGLFFGYGGHGRYGFFPRMRSAAVRFHDRIHGYHGNSYGYDSYAYSTPTYSSYDVGAYSSYPSVVVYDSPTVYSTPDYSIGCGVVSNSPTYYYSEASYVEPVYSSTPAPATYEYDAPTTKQDDSVLDSDQDGDWKKPAPAKNTETLPQPKPKHKHKHKKAPKGRLGFEMRVPADAKVFVDGYETQSTGEVRRFMTGVVKDQRAYELDIRVECERNGEQRIIQRTVRALPGVIQELDFTIHEPTMVTLNVPADAKVFVAGQETHSTGSVRTFTTADLASGATWSNYEVRVELERDGKTLSKSEMLRIVAGDNQTVTFDFAGDSLVARAK